MALLHLIITYWILACSKALSLPKAKRAVGDLYDQCFLVADAYEAMGGLSDEFDGCLIPGVEVTDDTVTKIEYVEVLYTGSCY